MGFSRQGLKVENLRYPQTRALTSPQVKESSCKQTSVSIQLHVNEKTGAQIRVRIYESSQTRALTRLRNEAAHNLFSYSYMFIDRSTK